MQAVDSRMLLPGSNISKNRNFYYTNNLLAEWICKTEIIEILLGPNTHAELVKRSSGIFTFLAKEGMFIKVMLDKIWGCLKDTHEEMAIGVFEILLELVPSISNEFVDDICDKIYTMDKYNEKTLQFIKEFNIKAFMKQKTLAGANNEGSVVYKQKRPFYCFELFWRIFQDALIGPPVDEIAFLAVKESISSEYMASQSFHYLKEAIKMIKQNIAVPQFAHLAIHILSIVIGKTRSDTLAIKSACMELLKEYPLIDIIVDSMETYNTEVNKFMQTEVAKSDSIIVPKKKHSENLDWRFRFLDLILQFADGALFIGKKNLERMWKIYVKNTLSEFDTATFMRFLSPESPLSFGKMNLKVIFHGAEENEFLFNLMCGDKQQLIEKHGSIFLKCIFKYFVIVNQEKGLILSKDNKLHITSINSLNGLSQIWEMIEIPAPSLSTSVSSGGFSPLADNLRNEISTFLIELYRNAEKNSDSAAEKDSMLANFVNNCMSRIIYVCKGENSMAGAISESSANKIVEAHVKLLQAFYEILEGKKYSNYPSRLSESLIDTIKYKIELKILPENISTFIEVGAHVKVGEIMRLIADNLNIPFGGFTLTSKAQSYDMDDEESIFNELGWHTDMIVLKKTEVARDPKKMMVQNEEYMNLLFQLLSRKNCSYVEGVWDLLMLLPCNDKIVLQIKKVSEMKEHMEESWTELFDYNSIYKMLYSLQGLNNIIADKKNVEENKNIIEKFTLNGGFKALYQGLLKMPLSLGEQSLSKKCFKSLLACINLILSTIDNKFFPIDYMNSIKEELCKRILLILNAFVEANLHSGIGKKDIAIEKIQKKQKEECKILKEGFDIAKKTVLSFNYFAEFIKHPVFKDLIFNSLVKIKSFWYSSSISKELIDMATEYLTMEVTPEHPLSYLLSLLLPNIPAAIKEAVQPLHYFNAIIGILEKYTTAALRKASSISIKNELINLVKLLTDFQPKCTEKPYFKHAQKGIIEVINALISKFPEFKRFLGQECGLINELLHSCLFDFPAYHQRGSSSMMIPKCKQEMSRKAAFNLLCSLARDTPENLSQVVPFLYKLHTAGSWRTNDFVDWHVNILYQEKSSSGYTGLQNLGATCYMNSVLQQLYMIPTFRYDIISMQRSFEDSRNTDESLLYQIQYLFSALTESVKPAVSPKVFAHSLKDWEGKPINTGIQMDADELFNMLMDRLEHAIKGKDKQNTIKAHFGGLFANQLIGKTCPHKKTREESFNTVSLQVKHKKSLIQSLDAFVEGELLAAGNSYYCDQCDKKVDTLKRACIKRLPKFLIFVLKRFEFNYDNMTKMKLNSYCEFPMIINMAPYTVKGMAMKDKGDANLLKGLEPEEYKLCGVVVHTGVAEGGHYYSLIKDREKPQETWYEFNDSNVRDFNIEKLSEEAFGGNEMTAAGIREKYHSAYLVIYERITPEKIDLSEEGAEEMASNFTVVRPDKFEVKIEEGFHKDIIADNMKYGKVQQIFAMGYLQFVSRLCNSWNSSDVICQNSLCRNDTDWIDPKEYEKLKLKPILKKHNNSIYNIDIPEYEKLAMTNIPREELEKLYFDVFKLAATVIFTTLLRLAGKMSVLPDFIDIAKSYMNKSPDAAKWLLMQFINEKTFKEFLFTCSDSENRKIVVGLMYAAMIVLNKSDKGCFNKYLANPSTDNILPNFINFVISQLIVARNFTRYFDQYFQIISRFVSLGPEARGFLLSQGIIKRLIGFYKNLPETNWENMESVKFTINPSPDIGFLQEVEEKYKSASDEKWAVKKLLWMKDATPAYTFLFETIWLLIRTTSYSLHVPASATSLAPPFPALASDPFLKTFFSTPANLLGFTKLATNNLAVNAIASMFAHLSTEDKSFKNIILSALIDALTQAEWEEYKKFGYYILALLQVNDSIQDRFIEDAMTEYSTMMKNCQKAFYPTFYGLENIFIWAGKCPKVLRFLKTYPQHLDWMVSWLTENSSPIIGQHALINLNKSKERNSTEINIAQTTMSDDFQKPWQSKVLEYRTICENFHKEDSEFTFNLKFEYENDLYHLCESKKWKQGDTFDKYDGAQKIWIKFVVERVLDEELWAKPLNSEDKNLIWIEIDTDQVAESGSYITVQEGKPTTESDQNMHDLDEIFDFSQSDTSNNAAGAGTTTAADNKGVQR